MNDLAWLALALAVITGVGWGMLWVVSPRGRDPFGERVALAFGLGTGIIFLGMLVAGLSGLGFTLKAILPLIVAPAAWGVWRRFKIATSEGETERPPSLSAGEWGLVGILALETLTVSLEAVAFPFVTWDAWTTWGLKSKAFFIDQGISPDFLRAPLNDYAHPDYPLLLPLLQSWIYLFLGRADEQRVLVVYPLFYTGSLVLFYRLARQYLTRPLALLLTVFFGAIPALWWKAWLGYAEIPLRFFLVGALTLIHDWLVRQDRSTLILGGLFLGLGASVKNEGLSLAVSVTLAVLAWCVLGAGRDRKRRLADWGVLAGLTFLLAAPWLVVRAVFHLRTQVFPDFDLIRIAQAVPERVPLIAWLFSREMVRRRWLGLWGLLVLVTILRKRSWKEADWLYTALITQLLIFGFVYLGTPDSAFQSSFDLPRTIRWELFAQHNIDRVVGLLAPFALHIIVLLCATVPALSRNGRAPMANLAPVGRQGVSP